LDWISCTFYQLISEVSLCIENPNCIDRFIDRITRKRNQDINQVDNSSKSIDSEKLNNNAIRRNEKVIIVNFVYHNQTVFIKGIFIGENIHILSIWKSYIEIYKGILFAIDFEKKPFAQKNFTLNHNLKKTIVLYEIIKRNKWKAIVFMLQ
jgi:hypothetical protein